MRRRPSSAIVVAHVRTPGLGERTTQFAVRRYEQVLEINHPLIHTRPARSTWRLHVDGAVIDEGCRASNVPEAVRFCYDVLLTLWWSFRKARRSDVFVGLGVLNGAAGILARYVRITASSRCWMIDYSPRRFQSKALSRLFLLIDAVVAWRSDETWNITEHIIEQHRRSRIWHSLRRRSNLQKVVPVGVDRLAGIGHGREPDRIVFVGHILEKQGVQLVVDALPRICARRPAAHLVVVGDGPHLQPLEKRVAQLGLTDVVDFRGFVDTDDEVWAILQTASIGVAPYLHMMGSFTYFADPGKVKLYAAAGLPICVTSVPSIAAQITASSCGIVVEDNAEAVADGIIRLLTDPDLEDRRGSAVTFASAYSWDRVLSHAFDGADSLVPLHSNWEVNSEEHRDA